MYATNVYQVLTTTVNGSTTVSEGEITGTYCNDPKFSNRLVWSDSADPDQTDPRGAV